MKSISFVAGLVALVLACTAQPAFAHEFIHTGGQGLAGKGGAQTITLGTHSVTCKAAAINGSIKTEALEMEISFEGCEAFSKPVTISGAAFKDSANNVGGITNGTTMKITAKPSEGAECVYTLPTTPTLVSSVTYTNEKAGVLVSHALKGLTYELKETGTTVCGSNGEKASTGEYKGAVTTESYEGARCVWEWGGAHGPINCSDTLGTGTQEIYSGYSSLKWS
ncbi:MAG: hypothetical protein ACLGG5_09330 [Thermoleophilia bacterium]